ncbi:hypothetical protein FJ364_04125, partial [Candidatus Dependentiae bacterium]|nr:hypothetical protein [Candidatus Dependentiae bacterium]
MEKSISLSLMSLMLVLASSFVYPVDMTEALATRALLPYLTSRSRTSFADGDNDRLRALAWHPTAQMFAVAGGPRSTNAEVMLYNVKSDSTGSYLEGVSGSITLGSGYTAKAAAWSSNGNYFAVGGSGVSTNQLKIYSYTSSTSLFTSVFSLTWGDAGSSINSVAWHPSGKYLAVGGSG